MQPENKLKRTLSLPLVTGYGLGAIIGAGIYVLIGKVAYYSSIYVPISFLLASLVAFFTAISYAELSSYYPLSGGAAIYVSKAFKKKWLTGLVGWLVVFTGIISAATLTHGFVGYFQLFFKFPEWFIITILIISLGLLASWGISESVSIATIITLIEVGGLVFILFIASGSFKALPAMVTKLIPPFDVDTWIGILNGTFLAFYAYIGFEDMVNIAEEIKKPRRTLPLAIFLALGIATLLYTLIAVVAVLSLSIHDLANSEAPLALIVSHHGYSTTLIGMISLIAVINGALVQIIMASRLIYGMAKIGNAPRYFEAVFPKTNTPIRSTILITLLILVSALWLPLITLAMTTNFIILCVFTLVNLSLVVIKTRKILSEKAINYSIFIPIIGTFLSITLLLMQSFVLIKKMW